MLRPYIILLWASKRDDPWAVIAHGVHRNNRCAGNLPLPAFRIIAATNRVVIAADKWGKIKPSLRM